MLVVKYLRDITNSGDRRDSVLNRHTRVQKRKLTPQEGQQRVRHDGMAGFVQVGLIRKVDVLA